VTKAASATRSPREICDHLWPMTVSIDRDGVERLVGESAQLVEVLPADDYEDEHLPRAVNIPLKELAERAPRELDPGRPVVVYCYDYQ
jgi:rhodanese-related sulfurtransferase